MQHPTTLDVLRRLISAHGDQLPEMIAEGERIIERLEMFLEGEDISEFDFLLINSACLYALEPPTSCFCVKKTQIFTGLIFRYAAAKCYKVPCVIVKTIPLVLKGIRTPETVACLKQFCTYAHEGLRLIRTRQNRVKEIY